MLNISESDFIKIRKLMNINDEKNLTLMFIVFIKADEIHKNDKKNSYIKIFEIDEDKTNKDDSHQE